MQSPLPKWARIPAIAVVGAVAAALVVTATPAQAQFSDGYKFLEAVRKKEGQKVEDALSEPGSTIIRSRDITSGETALHIVTQRRDITWLQYLVQKGADVNMRDERGTTPLQLATSLGWTDGVEFLVSRKANLDESDDAGETPLISAVHRKNARLMRVLLEGGADPDRADNSGRSARDYAKLAGNEALLTAIETHEKPELQRKPKTVYGPTF